MSDEQKRNQYDQYGHGFDDAGMGGSGGPGGFYGAGGAGSASGGFPGGFDPNDIFSQFFGGGFSGGFGSGAAGGADSFRTMSGEDIQVQYCCNYSIQQHSIKISSRYHLP